MEGQVQDGVCLTGEGSVMREDSFFERSSSKSPLHFSLFGRRARCRAACPRPLHCEQAPSCVVRRTSLVSRSSLDQVSSPCAQFLTADLSRPALRAFLFETAPSSLPGPPVSVRRSHAASGTPRSRCCGGTSAWPSLRTNSVNNTWASSQRPSMGCTRPPAALNSATRPSSSVPLRIEARVEASHLP